MYPEKILSISVLTLLIANTTVVAKNYSFQPIISIDNRWDSNYFYDNSNEKDVYTWLFQPGFKFSYQAARTQAEFSATLDGHMYSGGGLLADVDNFVGYTVGADVSSRPADFRRLTLGLRDKLLYTRNPEFIDEIRRSTSRELYKLNTLNPYVEYHFDQRYRAVLDYENTIIRYDENGNEDSTLHKLSLKALYRMNPTYEFGPRMKLEATNYDESSYDYSGIDLGGVLTRKGKFVNLEGGIGYHTRELDDPDSSKLDEISWQLALASQATGFNKTRFGISLLGDINDAVTEEGYYSTLQLKGSVSRKVMKHLDLGLNFLYAWDDYEHTGREDDIWKIGATAAYTITSWLELKLELAQQQCDSTINSYDYDNTSFAIKLNYIPNL